MNRFCKVSIEYVPTSMCNNLSLYSQAAKGQVADEVEQFVPRAFVIESKRIVDGTTWTKDHQFAAGHVRRDALRLKPAGFAFS